MSRLQPVYDALCIEGSPFELKTEEVLGVEMPVFAQRPRSLRALLEAAPGVEVMDERGPGGYPTAANEAAHHDAVFVGRLREDISCERGLNMWVVSDNVRKGAALNTIQIAESLVEQGLVGTD